MNAAIHNTLQNGYIFSLMIAFQLLTLSHAEIYSTRNIKCKYIIFYTIIKSDDNMHDFICVSSSWFNAMKQSPQTNSGKLFGGFFYYACVSWVLCVHGSRECEWVSACTFCRWRQEETSGPCLLQNPTGREHGCSTTPTYFNCSPKACWVSGKLKNWSVVKEMHATLGEKGKDGASRVLKSLRK